MTIICVTIISPSVPVVLVRDRDRVYGFYLPKFLQPAICEWRLPTRVRQAGTPPTHVLR